MKQHALVIEFRRKGRGMEPLNPLYFDQFQIIPLFGGNLNQNFAYQIALKFPEDIEVVNKKIKTYEIDPEMGLFEEVCEK